MNEEDISREKDGVDYGRIALILVIFLIAGTVIAHIGFYPSLKVQYYNCPGVGLQTDIDRFLGCTEAYTKEINFVWYLK